MEEKGAEIPSEIKSAINIALFRAQETYMVAMETQFSDYKNRIRQEMLTFMKQIRETVRDMHSVPSEQQQLRPLTELPTALVDTDNAESFVNGWHIEALKSPQVRDPMLSWSSPPPVAAPNNFNDVKASREPDAQQKAQREEHIPQHTEMHGRLTDSSPGPDASRYSEAWLDSLKETEKKNHQWPVVRIMHEFHVLGDSPAEYWFERHARIRKTAHWPHLRGVLKQRSQISFRRLVKIAGTPFSEKDSEIDPVVKALHRPRAGGGTVSFAC